MKFRKGWQSEHLARYILSKFSFVAEPANISDDLGSDFFCTLFHVEDKQFLIPQNSIAVQVKSNNNVIDISNKLDYLIRIEIPYFVGVVDKNNQIISFYSGEAIPHFFSLYGNPSGLPSKPKTFINLVDSRDNNKLYSKDQDYHMYFPKVVSISSDFDYEKNVKYLDSLKKLISIMQKNTSAHKSAEYLFDYADKSGINIFAGPGSVTTYQENLCKRLAEAFYNVEYKSNRDNKKHLEEFKIYENTLHELQKVYETIPPFLEKIYQKTKEKMGI